MVCLAAVQHCTMRYGGMHVRVSIYIYMCVCGGSFYHAGCNSLDLYAATASFLCATYIFIPFEWSEAFVFEDAMHAIPMQIHTTFFPVVYTLL